MLDLVELFRDLDADSATASGSRLEMGACHPRILTPQSPARNPRAFPPFSPHSKCSHLDQNHHCHLHRHLIRNLVYTSAKPFHDVRGAPASLTYFLHQTINVIWAACHAARLQSPAPFLSRNSNKPSTALENWEDDRSRCVLICQ